MKNDKELLELAARAAGIELSNGRDVTGMHPSMNIYAAPFWNPLTDDGDALRLAVKLGIVFVNDLSPATGIRFVRAGRTTPSQVAAEVIDSDFIAATRRAIVRAAAAIGEKI